MPQELDEQKFPRRNGIAPHRKRLISVVVVAVIRQIGNQIADAAFIKAGELAEDTQRWLMASRAVGMGCKAWMTSYG
ncbi:MAG: hypothetical protein ACRDRA_19305, partial [Pseudonocardiaceae bacterium]